MNRNESRFRKLLAVKDKLKYAWENCKTKLVCEYCEAQLFPLRKTGMSLNYDVMYGTRRDTRELTADEAKAIITRMSDETCRILGLKGRPENMILSALLVPPICVRPSVRVAGSEGRGEDDLTQMLIMIVRYNNDLRKCMNQRNQSGIKFNRDMLQSQINCYFDGDVKGQPITIQRGSRTLKSITTRLKSKEGDCFTI